MVKGVSEHVVSLVSSSVFSMYRRDVFLYAVMSLSTGDRAAAHLGFGCQGYQGEWQGMMGKMETGRATRVH